MIITAYKGFDPNLSCRGFRYELGKDYTMDKTPKLCQVGFHACVFPLDVLNYYPYGVYAKVIFDCSKVDGLGELSGHRKKDSKICGSSIHICESLVDTSVLFMESLRYLYQMELKFGNFPRSTMSLVKASGLVGALYHEVKDSHPVALWHMLQFTNVYNAIYDFWNYYTKNKTPEEMIDIYKTMGAIKEEEVCGNRVKNILVDEEN